MNVDTQWEIPSGHSYLLPCPKEDKFGGQYANQVGNAEDEKKSSIVVIKMKCLGGGHIEGY